MQRAAKAAHPNEACGLLFGAADAVTECAVTRNVAEDPTRCFEVDPSALFAALRGERAGGQRLVGYWHSHPSGDATPSQADAVLAQPDDKLWLIVAGETVRAWRSGADGLHGRFAPVILALID